MDAFLTEVDLTTKIIKTVSMPDGITGVYFLFDSEEYLIYIGQAYDLRKRLTAHLQGKRDIAKVCIIQCESHELNWLEGWAHHVFMPGKNWQPFARSFAPGIKDLIAEIYELQHISGEIWRERDDKSM